jgi:hypothetical protein
MNILTIQAGRAFRLLKINKELHMKNLLPFFILVLSFNVSGQPGKWKVKPPSISEPVIVKKHIKKPRCGLSLEASPVLRGLKLGITVNETAQLFGKTSEDSTFKKAKSSEDNPAKIAIDSEMLKKISEFNFVKSLDLEFYGGKLYKIAIRYSEDEVTFSTNRQFAENISEKLNLPKKPWVYYKPILPGVGSLRCREFQVDVQYTLNEIVLIDLAAAKILENKEEEKRKNFKP